MIVTACQTYKVIYLLKRRQENILVNVVHDSAEQKPDSVRWTLDSRVAPDSFAWATTSVSSVG